MNRLTIMLRYADEARADVAVTADKVYYRFATDDSIEDGELPPFSVDFTEFADTLVRRLTATDGEDEGDEALKVEIFTDNRINPMHISRQSVRRAVDYLAEQADEFTFLGGFCL